EPVCCRESSAFHFYATLTCMLSILVLIRHQGVQLVGIELIHMLRKGQRQGWSRSHRGRTVLLPGCVISLQAEITHLTVSTHKNLQQNRIKCLTSSADKRSEERRIG